MAALLGKVALIAPFAGLLLNIGPPWPSRTAVPALTSLCEVLVLVYAFSFYSPLSKKRIANRLRCISGNWPQLRRLHLALQLFRVRRVQTSEMSKASSCNRRFRQWSHPGDTLESLLEGAEWDPFKIWEGWTILIREPCLATADVDPVFVGIAGCLATFVVLQRADGNRGRRIPRERPAVAAR